jgi:hypothetical protein
MDVARWESSKTVAMLKSVMWKWPSSSSNMLSGLMSLQKSGPYYHKMETKDKKRLKVFHLKSSRPNKINNKDVWWRWNLPKRYNNSFAVGSLIITIAKEKIKPVSLSWEGKVIRPVNCVGIFVFGRLFSFVL